MDFILKSLRCHKPHVVFQECPGEVALCFSFFGCPLRCDGCHSEELWDDQGGNELTPKMFEHYLNQYKGLISAVVLFGGEWQPKNLQTLLIIAQQHNLKTCLYTGLNAVSRHLRPYLDFAKVGPWTPSLGGLDSATSNQKFYALKNGQLSDDLTHLFRKDEHIIKLLTLEDELYEPCVLTQIDQQIALLEMEMTLVNTTPQTPKNTRAKRFTIKPAVENTPYQYTINLQTAYQQEPQHAAA